MTARMLLAWTATLAVSASAVGITIANFVHARAQGEQSLAQLNRCRRDAERVRQLRDALPTCLTRNQDASPLGPRLHKVLAGVNLAPSVLTNLAPQSGTSIPLRAPAATASPPLRPLRPLPPLSPPPPSQLVLERIAIRLEPLTLPELGTFLKAWQTAEPCWAIALIDVVPILPDRGAKPAPGSELPVRAGLTLESLSLKNPRGHR